MLELKPISYSDAIEFVRQHHRHHPHEPNRRSFRFAIAVADDDDVVGVLIAGRPIARALNDGLTLEVHRCCTNGTPHAASKLYAAARRAACALGYRRIITYTLASEVGTSLKAAGWHVAHTMQRWSPWNHAKRPRRDKGPREPKVRWEALTTNVREKTT